VGAETDRRGFVPVDEKMRVLGKDGAAVPNVYCIGDANGARPAAPGRVWAGPEQGVDRGLGLQANAVTRAWRTSDDSERVGPMACALRARGKTRCRCGAPLLWRGSCALHAPGERARQRARRRPRRHVAAPI